MGTAAEALKIHHPPKHFNKFRTNPCSPNDCPGFCEVVPG